MLGLNVDAWDRRVTFDRAMPPPWLNRLEIRGLTICDARLDLSISRGRYSSAVEVIEKHGEVEVVVRK
jgi:hypothetical protein